MSNSLPRFYIAGGTIPREAPSYIPRRADMALYDSLLQGDFCYVLTSRQMGKSSLMVRTAAHLRETESAIVVLDLSALGQELTAAQWYDSMLAQVGEQLSLEDELEVFCAANRPLSPLQRWSKAIREILRKWRKQQIVIFIDEIDITRSLPFSTDEFFVAIRELYNSRVLEPELNRLTFCLLGVAAPSDLICNVHTTPFNIGKRIELSDFTQEEARPLAIGIEQTGRDGKGLLERVLYWTSGHPYLTQCLCKAVAEESSIHTSKGVDRLCRELFLDPKAGSTEVNLSFVRRRLVVEEGEQRAALLTLYGQVLAGKRIEDKETDAPVAELKLSGVVSAADGYLVPRNRIYRSVFDMRWVAANMPNAELRRQRVAYRRGVLRTALMASLVFLVIAALGGIAVVQYLMVKAERNRARHFEYTYAIRNAQYALDSYNIPAAFKSLERQRPQPGDKEDMRRFEWRYLWQRLNGDRSLLSCPEMNIFAVAVSPNGRFVAAAGQARTGETHTIRLWELATQRELPSFSYPGEVNSLTFSPDGRILAAGGGVVSSINRPGSVCLWNMVNRRLLTTLSSEGAVRAIAFTHDGSRLVVAGDGRLMHWWDMNTFGDCRSPCQVPGGITNIAISSDDTILAFNNETGFDLWSVRSGRRLRSVHAISHVYTMTFSLDSKTLTTGSADGAIRIWDVRTGECRRTLKSQNPANIHSLAYSSDGRMLAAASWDCVIRLWDVASGSLLQEFTGHVRRVNSVVFTPDNRMLVSGSNDGTVRLWDVRPALTRRIETGTQVVNVALSDDGKTLATTDGERKVRLWDTASGRSLGTPTTPATLDDRGPFSADGRMLVCWPWDRMFPPPEEKTPSQIPAPPVEVPRPITLQDLIARRGIIIPLAKFIPQVQSTALSPDGDTIALIGPDRDRKTYGDGTLELWNVRTRCYLGAIRGASGNHITALAFSHDGKRIATGGWDWSVRIWEAARITGIQDGRQKYRTLAPVELDEFGSQVCAIAFSWDGRTLAVGTQDHKISLCSLDTQDIVAVLAGTEGHTDAVTSLVFSYNDSLLVSGSLDGTARLWRAAPFTHTDDPAHVALKALLMH